jgi:4-hydroxy-2-oxoheptanedioate aldolase
MRRDVGFVLEPGAPSFVKALDDAVIALMIEKDPAVQNLESLLSVKGVDMVQFGPADYSMSLGLTGQWDHPKVREAEKYVIETALKMGIAPRAEISRPDEAARYLDMGVRHFCIGSDVNILFNWFRDCGQSMNQLLKREVPAAAPEVKSGYRA